MEGKNQVVKYKEISLFWKDCISLTILVVYIFLNKVDLKHVNTQKLEMNLPYARTAYDSWLALVQDVISKPHIFVLLSVPVCVTTAQNDKIIMKGLMASVIAIVL